MNGSRVSGVAVWALIAASVWGALRVWAQGSSDEGLDLLLQNQPQQEEKRPAKEEKQPAEKEQPAAEPKEAKPAATPQPEVAAASVEKPAAVRERRPAQGVEEIVVTARKTEENIQDVPVAVTALSANALEQTSTAEMSQLQLRVPNMAARPGGGQSTALVFQMRGQVQSDIVGTLDPSIGFYDDGIYVARPHGANASFVDVKNVQVLRGPQGTLFGRNTTGGAVLLNTNDPDFDGVSGSLSGSIGSFAAKNATGVLNLPLLYQQLALRVAGQTLSTDGFGFDETNNRKIATEEHDLLRAKLLYQPLDGLSLLLGGQYINVDQLGTPVKPLFALKPQQAKNPGVCCLASLNSTAQGVDYDSFIGGDPDRVSNDQGIRLVNKITVKALTLTTVWDRPWATIKLIGGLRRNENAANRIDLDGTPSTIVDTLQANSNRQGSAELQFTGSWFSDRLKWAAGAVYFDESGKDIGITSALVPVATAINPILTFGVINNKSAGGYVQGTYSLTPKLRVTGGVRYSWDDKRLVLDAEEGSTCALPSDKQDPGTACQGTFDNSFNNTSFTAGTDYRLFENTPVFDDLLTYFSVTTGYRAGGQNLRGTSDATLAPFKPETLMQFEAGFKGELLDHRVRLNGAGFYTLYHDVQRTVIVASSSVLPATLVSNAASATVAGSELELTALPPISGLELAGSLGITLPKYNKFVDSTGDRTNEKFDDVPTKTYSLSAAYTHEVLGMPWLNRLDWSWKDEIPYSQGNLKYFRDQGFDIERLVTQPPIGILNARSALTFRTGLDLGVFGKNLTDERQFYALALSGGPDFASKFVTAPGRELGFDVTVRF